MSEITIHKTQVALNVRIGVEMENDKSTRDGEVTEEY